jgi:N-acylneuraminate cytidylyltransferase
VATDVNVLGVVAARGGSKGLPGKNIQLLAGKPLIAWTIDAARRSAALSRRVLSTDSAEIAEVGRQHGIEVPFLRPAELATDTARIEDAILHTLDNLDGPYDYVVLLQATSPLRTAEDIDKTVARCIESGAPACVTVTIPSKSPYWMFKLDGGEHLEPLFDLPMGRRRQDLPAAYVPNGAVYVARVEWFREHGTFYGRETVASIMPPERSLDVDSALDLRIADSLLSETGG